MSKKNNTVLPNKIKVSNTSKYSPLCFNIFILITFTSIILPYFPKIWYNYSMARKIKMRPISKQNRNNNHKHSDKRQHPRLKDGR